MRSRASWLPIHEIESHLAVSSRIETRDEEDLLQAKGQSPRILYYKLLVNGDLEQQCRPIYVLIVAEITHFWQLLTRFDCILDF